MPKSFVRQEQQRRAQLMREYPPHLRNQFQDVEFDEDLFFYVIAFGNMAPAAVVIQQLTIQADSDFEWVKSMYYSTLSGGLTPFQTQQFPEITMQIQDNGSGRNLTFGNVPLASMAGSGAEPFINPVARIFESKTTVQFTATSIAPASTYNAVTLTLAGRKIFRMSR